MSGSLFLAMTAKLKKVIRLNVLAVSWMFLLAKGFLEGSLIRLVIQ